MGSCEKSKWGTFYKAMGLSSIDKHRCPERQQNATKHAVLFGREMKRQATKGSPTR